MAGSDGRSDAVRRAVARTFRTDRRARYVGACWASVRTRCDGQATCGHDGRHARAWSGDSDGFGGYGRLAAGGASAGAFGRRARSSGRGRGGCAKIAVPWYPMRSDARNFFCKRRVLSCGNSCGMCVSSKKYTSAPRTAVLPPRAARKTLAAATRKKIHVRPAGGHRSRMARETPPEKNSPPLKKYRLL